MAVVSFGTTSVGATQADVFADFYSSSVPTEYTPAHTVTIQNGGSGTIRLGASGVNASQGLRLGPGEMFRERIGRGGRLFYISESGTATNISVLLILE